MGYAARTVSGEIFKSKSALVKMLKAEPSNVVLESMAFVGPEAGKSYRGSELPSGLITISGPDPLGGVPNKWYANIKNGKVS